MSQEKVWIGSNLKMYKTRIETLDYLISLGELTREIPRDALELFILPSYLALQDSVKEAAPYHIKIGAQNVHWAEEGQFTGEISVSMLKDIGVDLVMIGHAERRQVFFETDKMVNQRTLVALNNGLQVLICVGDTPEDKAFGISEERLVEQLKTALNGVPEENLSKIWVAYEPVWAIGESGQAASPEFANLMQARMHSVLRELYPHKGPSVPILYGGSVNTGNAAELIIQPEIDGLFVGRAAWDADDFLKLIEIALQNDN